jgi:hypothetical protein
MVPLKTILEILSDLDFLKYSTRKRNLAYQLQYLEFKMNLLTSGTTYGAVRGCLMRDLVINTTNIIEYLLFISLRTIYGKDPKPCKFPHLVGQAKKNGIIRKKLSQELNKIEELRNRLHPSKQKNDLDIKFFNRSQVNSCLSALNTLKQELKYSFKSQNIKVETAGFICPYEGWSQALFPNLMCPHCGGMHF